MSHVLEHNKLPLRTVESAHIDVTDPIYKKIDYTDAFNVTLLHGDVLVLRKPKMFVGLVLGAHIVRYSRVISNINFLYRCHVCSRSAGNTWQRL